MVIRLADAGDASQLSVLNQEFNNSNASADDIAAYLANSPAHEKTVVADLDGEIIGFACVQVYRSWCYLEPWAELTELYVKPGYRRCGYARAMVTLLEQFAREAGATDIFLVTGEMNMAAQSLYRSCGYDSDQTSSFCKELPSA
ncbi:MAG: GNAT family N-acetyltransferase [Armatimonadota bacterium]